jgi:RNA-directed DNA polymerase
VLLERMASELSLAEKYVSMVAATASYRYRDYVVKGRSGAPRVVYHPSRPLKALQRWLARRILCDLLVHDVATAYELGRGILLNAERHRGSRFLLRMDFTEFFPSLTSSDVETMLDGAKSSGRFDASWNADDTLLLVRLVSRFGQLVIGAPTSPKLSSALCFDMDEALLALSKRYDCVYTRYADDLFFSSTRANVLAQVENEVTLVVAGLAHPSQLKINVSKTRHSSMRGRRTVTGIILTSDGMLSLGRSRKRIVRSLVYKYSMLSEPERQSLRGWLAYCRSVEPEFINALVLKFGAERLREVISP